MKAVDFHKPKDMRVDTVDEPVIEQSKELRAGRRSA